MAPSAALLVLGTMAVVVCDASAKQAESSTTEFNGIMEHESDVTALIQTDVAVSTNSERSKDGSSGCRRSAASSTGIASGPMGMLEQMWRWVTLADKPETSANDATEAAKRFHKDFIAAALLMTCVLPWSRQTRGVEHATQNRLLHTLPSSQTLRYLAVLLLWLKHYWFQSHYASLEIMFVLLGLMFDFTDQHADCEDDMWKRLGDFVPERFSRLYPLYTLFVIVCYLVLFSSPCSAIEKLFGGNVLLSYSCGLGAWLLSVAFGCYLVVTVLASPPEDIQPSSTAMICAGCVAMVLLPRTLAAPVHGPWAWSEDQASSMDSNPDGVIYELFFARRSLLLGLAHFFLGLVLARARLVVKNGGLCDEVKEPQVEIPNIAAQDSQFVDKPEVDVWKEFEDEARRDMIRSLCVNRASEHMD